MNARTLLLPLAALAFVQPAWATQEAAAKSDLRVLLVSHDPEAPQLAFASMAKERTHELYGERAAAFESLLNEHFEHVRLVYGADYEVSMSDAVDVTIFDARPRKRSSGGYLPESFDRPALLIAENSPLIGEPIGLKLDWL